MFKIERIIWWKNRIVAVDKKERLWEAIEFKLIEDPPRKRKQSKS